MNSYDCIKMLLEARHCRSGLRFLLAPVFTIGALGFAVNGFAQPIKIAYAALVAGQIPFGSQRKVVIFQKTASMPN
jgi:hypothetical protein